MKKYRKIGIALIILIIGIAAWQIYGYIERSTRPEPAVVYTKDIYCSSSGLPRQLTRLMLKISKKLKFTQATKRFIMVSDAGGRRKWAVKENKQQDLPFYQFLAEPYTFPEIFLESDGEKNLLCSEVIQDQMKVDARYLINLKNGNTSEKDDLPLFLMNPEYVGSSTINVVYNKENNKTINFYLKNKDGVEFNEIEWKTLATALKGMEGLNVYAFQKTLLLVGYKPKTTQHGEDRIMQCLVFFDIETETVVSEYMLPIECASIDFSPVPMKEYSCEPNSSYLIDVSCSLIRPPKNNHLVTLLITGDIIQNGQRVGDVEKLIDFDYLNGTQMPISLPKTVSPSTVNNRTKINCMCFNECFDTSYISFDNRNSRVLIKFILNRDNTWSEPLQIPCDSFDVASDGTMWGIQYPGDSREKKHKLIKYNPADNSQIVVDEAGSFNILGVLY